MASGTAPLEITDVRVGAGAEAVNGKKLTIHYSAKIEDGKQFRDTRQEGKPFTFKFGEGIVIPGLEQGLVGMKSGGVRRLVVPPQLAYGSRFISNTIPPNSTLIFETPTTKHFSKCWGTGPLGIIIKKKH